MFLKGQSKKKLEQNLSEVESLDSSKGNEIKRSSKANTMTSVTLMPHLKPLAKETYQCTPPENPKHQREEPTYPIILSQDPSPLKLCIVSPTHVQDYLQDRNDHQHRKTALMNIPSSQTNSPDIGKSISSALNEVAKTPTKDSDMKVATIVNSEQLDTWKGMVKVGKKIIREKRKNVENQKRGYKSLQMREEESSMTK